MNPLKMYQIEVDEEVYNLLKQNAEPFKDTPNSVLRRFLTMKTNHALIEDSYIKQISPRYPESVPNALAEILEVIKLVKKGELSRNEATHIVAKNRGITTQAVIDKYTRQLDKKADEIDGLLMNLEKFKTILFERFPRHSEVIQKTFLEFNA